MPNTIVNVKFFVRKIDKKFDLPEVYFNGLRGAMVARLTPDQKAACSNHVGVT